jgi:8-oxo-dGTP pyrophosphatase MutT (NUDIX family)
MEEVGETLTEFVPCGVFPATSLIYAFAARLDAPAESLALTEGQRVQFFAPHDALRLPLVPWLYDMLPGFSRSEAFARLRDGPPQPRLSKSEAASVVFVNPLGELLLRLRDDAPGLPFRAMWDLIGGALEPGETHAEAILRETLEELCFDLAGHAYWRLIQGLVPIHVYLAPLDTPADSLTLTEGERIAWFTPTAAQRLPLVPYMHTLLPPLLASEAYLRLARARP